MKGYQFASPIAHLIGLVAGKIPALRITGVAPYRSVPAEPFIAEMWDRPTPFTVSAPVSLDPSATWEKFPEDSIKHHYLAVVDDGIAFSHGIVMGPDGAHIPGVSHKTDDNDGRRRKRRFFGTPILPYRPLPAMLRVKGPVVVATSSNQHFFFHWMLDVLPRLIRLQTGSYSDAPIFVDASHPFQRQTLSLLGIGSDRIIEANKTPLLTSDRLVVPCYQCALGCTIPRWVIEGLRGLVPADVLIGGAGRRLYLTRADAPHRQMSNEEAVVGLTQKFGFETVRMSELDFVDQARLFADASHIIAPHGGGLANLMFCRPGTAVLELFPQVTQDVYYRMSHALGLDYRFIKSSTQGYGDGWPGLSDHDVDLDLLEIYLNRL